MGSIPVPRIMQQLKIYILPLTLLLGVWAAVLYGYVLSDQTATTLPFPVAKNQKKPLIVAISPNPMTSGDRWYEQNISKTAAKEDGNGDRTEPASNNRNNRKTNNNQASAEGAGFEMDLLREFANEHDFVLEFRYVSQNELPDLLARGAVHMASAWLPADKWQFPTCPSIRQTHNVIVQNEASLTIKSLSQLAGRHITVLPDSRQAADLATQTNWPKFIQEPYRRGNLMNLLNDLNSGIVPYAIIDSDEADLAINWFPSIQKSLALPGKVDIVWYVTPSAKPLLPLCQQFIQNASTENGLISRLLDRYLGHIQRLDDQNILVFLQRINEILPKYKRLFEQAQARTGIDWRILAALSYQESQWDPFATSPTGVRGMMMLTADTADYLNVSNRLDARESILAGADYVDQLLKRVAPESVLPDRQWISLAAYNLGAGAVQIGRRLAKQRGLNPNSWFDLKKILPQLAKPEIYEQFSPVRIRGGEAVIMVENIRLYYDILVKQLDMQSRQKQVK